MPRGPVRQRATPPSLEEVLEGLLSKGVIKDEAVARRRIRLGYPAWLVLGELTPRRLLQTLSRASGVPMLKGTLAGVGLDQDACELVGAGRLLEARWAPLADGRVAVADPLKDSPDGVLAGRPLCVASYKEIDSALEGAFAATGAEFRRRRRLGRYLLDAGVASEEVIADALEEQARNGGRLGEILLARGSVDPGTLSDALAERIGLASVPDEAIAVPLLSRRLAHELRAVAIEADGVTPGRLQAAPDAVTVAMSDPSEERIAAVGEQIGRPIEAQITDDRTLDALLASVYAEEDMLDVVGGLQIGQPDLSAYRTGLSRPQAIVIITLFVALLMGVILNAHLTSILVIGAGTLAYVAYTVYRLYSAWRGWRLGAIVDPSPEELTEMDGRELPSYTVLLPVFREKPRTLHALFESLSNLDYPKQKLNGLLLLEADDTQTLEALEQIESESVHVTLGSPRPAWLKTLLIPPGEPRTKPKAMIYGLLYASGELLTIFDAEDKPEPDQLKKAAWAFQHAEENVACIQAKLSYYNSRQNLLTRWFTLEYAAWFDLFLPGLHSMSAPIPLGGTSNHFRLSLLKEVLSWDPYNVTEDADLGLRFTRAGYRTQMLESTTFEEANSNFKNWLRQRSRWIKGYMQTFLVHTRDPVRLYRELGAVNCVHFVATVGGLIYTVVVSPLFWALLVMWLLFKPGWIPALFPGPVYYLAMASLAIGNFFFVFLALVGAVGRGQDDLAPYTLIFPIYWLMMSCAAYLALYELIRKPHYWQKTEHGLHLAEVPAAVGMVADAEPALPEDYPRAA